jgi:NodT family efflux transporter outer membrane factor (OMF) lipoprotein
MDCFTILHHRRNNIYRHTDGKAVRMKVIPFTAVICMLLSGCASVGQKYIPPETKIPEKWSSTNDSLTSKATDVQVLANWWTLFNDPVLTNLVEQAVNENNDIKKAQARVREVRARRAITKSDFLPSLKANASSSKSRSEDDNGDVTTNEFYNAGFDASWEIDVFGKTRYSVDAADALLEANIESLRDMLVSVTAEVALNYVEVRTYQTRLSIAETNLRIQSDTLDIVKWRAEAGLTTQLDVEQAKYALEQTRSTIPSLTSNLTQSKNGLAVLLGKTPSSLNGILYERKDIPIAPVEVAVGVPADVLRQRPDVRKAERTLAEKMAQTAATKASRYPSFTLNGSTGLESLELSDLFSSSTWLSSIAANIGYTLFDAGSIRQNIIAQSAVQEQTLADYESTVLTALEEVENALVAYANEQVRRHSLNEAAQSAKNAVEMVTIQYNSGQKDFRDLLEAQRSLLTYQDNLASSDGEITSDLIRLYKALGGGWDPMTPSNTK